MTIDDQHLTTAQAAKRVGVTRRAILKWIERGRLPAEKHGRDWSINPADLVGLSREKPGPKAKPVQS